MYYDCGKNTLIIYFWSLDLIMFYYIFDLVWLLNIYISSVTFLISVLSMFSHCWYIFFDWLIELLFSGFNCYFYDEDAIFLMCSDGSRFYAFLFKWWFIIAKFKFNWSLDCVDYLEVIKWEFIFYDKVWCVQKFSSLKCPQETVLFMWYFNYTMKSYLMVISSYLVESFDLNYSLL